jgi:mannosyltransferase
MCLLLPRYPDFTAVIIGLTTADNLPFVEKLKAQIAAAGLQDRIRFLGELPIEEVPLWYQRISIYVFASRVEGFGLTMLEAMAAGNAVVATRAGAAEIVITDGENGVLAPTGDVSALAASIEPLMQQPERIGAIGARARAEIVANFNRNREVGQIVEVYRRLWAETEPKAASRL